MNRIRILREEKGWNQDILAKKLNVKRAAVSKYENGKIPLTDDTIIKLTEIFEVTSDFLLGRSDTKAAQIEQPLPEELEFDLECRDLTRDEFINAINYVRFLKQQRNDKPQ